MIKLFSSSLKIYQQDQDYINNLNFILNVFLLHLSQRSKT